MAQRQRFGFQTQRLRVQVPLGSRLVFADFFCFEQCGPMIFSLSFRELSRYLESEFKSQTMRRRLAFSCTNL